MSRVTVWHDGDCPLCTREIALIRRLDRAGSIDFVDVAAEAGPLEPVPYSFLPFQRKDRIIKPWDQTPRSSNVAMHEHSVVMMASRC